MKIPFVENELRWSRELHSSDNEADDDTWFSLDSHRNKNMIKILPRHNTAKPFTSKYIAFMTALKFLKSYLEAWSWWW